MKKILASSALLCAIAFFSCKKEESKSTTNNTTIATDTSKSSTTNNTTNNNGGTNTPKNGLEILVNGKADFSHTFKSTTIGYYDSVLVTFKATGEDYSVNKITEKAISYVTWDTTMNTNSCNRFTGGYIKEKSQQIFVVKNGETVTKVIYFSPNSFSYQTFYGMKTVTLGGQTFPIPDCRPTNSDGVGEYKSLINLEYQNSAETTGIVSLSLSVTGTGTSGEKF